ncbi:hypothetical protein BJF92_00345 [Rhizobium rhizosphaerae]|uniref:Thermonuclease family protein n=1 Tax=Xaviernesmea rhizosphaerae TaxID=1672749 RepID=A0A1Q9AE75_9HYPH|nr:thermonuclease family protein [Xaviernesmea rhizosphaerae]OLP53257.1 hypothetical protein BJF92_00345 [Xaviernesmea rhizosphaerae]
MRRSLISAGGGLACLLATCLILWGGAASIRARDAAGSSTLSLETPDAAEVPADADPLAAMTQEEVPALPADEAASAETGSDRPAQDAQGAGPAPGSALPATSAQVTSAPLAPPDGTATGDMAQAAPAPAPASTPTPTGDIDMLASSETRNVVLRHPIVLSAGLIRFPSYRVQLAGINPEEQRRRCGTGRDSWPCGALARTAFRNFVRARTFVCSLPKDLSLPEHQLARDPAIVAKCSVGGDDPAEWLVRHGWAEVPAGSDLAPLMEKARQEQIGFFGPDPRKDEAKRMQDALDTAPADMAPDAPDGEDSGDAPAANP